MSKYIVIFTLLFCFSCEDNKKQLKNYNQKRDLSNKEKVVNENIGFINYPKPIVVDTGSFLLKDEGFTVKHYHINAYSIVDTADIQFYVDWSDSILHEFNGGNKSHVYFFDSKNGTPSIPLANFILAEEYKKHCFLYINYQGDSKDYYWNPFEKKETFR